jgi:hypothetical protein
MTRDEYVAHKLGGILYESWDPHQVHAVAILACEAVDDWHRKQANRLDLLPLRRDLTVHEAALWRAGIEDAAQAIHDHVWGWE